MRKIPVHGIAVLTIMAMLTGCSGNKKLTEPILTTNAEEQEEQPSLLQNRIPISINGHEILVGTTTIQELLDNNFRLTVSEWDGHDITRSDIDPEATLKTGSINNEISFQITNASFARISIIAKTADIKIGDAPISRFELHMSLDETLTPKNVLLDGVSVDEISRSKAAEMFPDFKQENLEISQSEGDYKCSLMFSPQTLKLYQFSLRDTYGEEQLPEIKIPSLW